MTFQIEINGLPVTAGFSEENIEEIFLPLLKHLTKLQSGLGRRILVFLAAPPGAGKSTLAEFLRYLSVNTPGVTPVTITGMDGFHRRQEYLLSHTTVRDGIEIPSAGAYSALPRERRWNGLTMTGHCITLFTEDGGSQVISCFLKEITCSSMKRAGGISGSTPITP